MEKTIYTPSHWQVQETHGQPPRASSPTSSLANLETQSPSVLDACADKVSMPSTPRTSVALKAEQVGDA